MAVQIDMIGLVVSDMAQALRFYRFLGLAVPEGQDGEDYAEVITDNGYRISFNSRKMIEAIDPEYVNPVGYRTELAFKCDTPSEVDSLYTKLIQAGYVSHKEPWDAFWGQRYAQVDDPDGNHVSLFAPLVTTA